MKYRYVYKVYTDNLCWGRMYLGKADTRGEAHLIGKYANRGVYVIEKSREYIG